MTPKLLQTCVRPFAHRTSAKACRTRINHRHLTTSAPQGQAQQASPSRIDRITSRLPRFLQRYTTPLRNAPISHITAFLVLHELTAIVPLFGLAATFHYTHWLPPMVSEWSLVSDGAERFGNYFKRKGWLGEESAGRWKWWGRGEGSMRIIVEFATAYAITKAFLPLRLILSVSGTPWFARVAVLPFINASKRLFGRTKGTPTSVAAGTGATTTGAASKAKPIAKSPSINE